MRYVLAIVGWTAVVLAGLILTVLVLGYDARNNVSYILFTTTLIGGLTLLGLSAILARLDGR